MELDKNALGDAVGELDFQCSTCGDGTLGRCLKCHDMITRIVTAYETTYHPLIKSVEALQELPVGSIVVYGGHAKYERDTANEFYERQWLTFGSRAEIAAANIPLPVRLVWKPIEE